MKRLFVGRAEGVLETRDDRREGHRQAKGRSGGGLVGGLAGEESSHVELKKSDFSPSCGNT